MKRKSQEYDFDFDSELLEDKKNHAQVLKAFSAHFSLLVALLGDVPTGNAGGNSPAKDSRLLSLNCIKIERSIGGPLTLFCGSIVERSRVIF